MQVKYLHEAMQQFSDNFTRNMVFSGVAVRTVYKFPLEVPWLGNKAVVADEHFCHAKQNLSGSPPQGSGSLLQ